MQIKFEASQEFQLKAIEAVAGLLQGQPRLTADLTFAPGGGGFAAVANRLDLVPEDFLANLRRVQDDGGLAPDDAFQTIEGEIETAAGPKTASFPNFSVEMETGTGKTYVYLRTALELYTRYGLRKFIVVVPSVAVREGVLKTLEITAGHFRELYGNPPCRFYAYNSERLAQVRQFALSDGIEIMVMTIDAFNKAANVIRQRTDRLQGEIPLHLIQTARPILILDEPQNMESEKSVAALAALDPLMALRYSATHRNPYNLVHRLTPFEAYRQGLVKRIEVASVIKENDENQVYVKLVDLWPDRPTPKAKLAIHQLMKDGTVKEKIVTVKPGDSLAVKANRPEYQGYEIDEINAGSEFILFANGRELSLGEARGADKDAIFEAQIRSTIEEHFRKQARLKKYGIKVLSLFFIDHVANYAGEDAIIRRLFDQAFNALKHDEWAGREPREVQAAYFANKRRRDGSVEFLESNGKKKEDEDEFNLIMRDKERLLSFDEPVSFIFSHSALREGWDNPNVFQICTLNQTASEMKKRQEVGRGVRLPVNQQGERVKDEKINVLTVIANESYDLYVSRLQSEIEEEYGAEGVPPKPANARKRKTAKLRKAYLLKPEFKELWERVKHKTRYAVEIDTEHLLTAVVQALDQTTIRPPRVAVTKVRLEVGPEDAFEALQLSAAKTALDLAGRYPLPNMVDIMENLMEHTSPPIKIARRTLLQLFLRIRDRKAATENPYEFATAAARLLKEHMAEQLVDGIQYEKINDWYQMERFDAEIEGWEEYLIPSQRPGGKAGAGLYDYALCESDVEKDFVRGLEHRADVRFYVKLPFWFVVQTPVGEYNPDWAIVMDNPEGDGKPLLYLVRETKGDGELRATEKRKTICGKKHFSDALGVDYRVVTKASDLP